MVPLPFPAGIYADADWACTHPNDQPNELLKQILLDARTGALQELHRLYFNAVEIDQLSAHTEQWIENAPPQALALEAGKVYVTLDYFSACLPLPRRTKKLRARKEAVFCKHFDQRSRDNIQANATALLKALAISGLIPDEWFPEKRLGKLIENEIRRAGIYSQIEVDFDLRIPPGGLQWLSEATMQTVTVLREKLATGHPWPVRMVCSPGSLHGNRQVIVYACHEQNGGKLRLEVFEPGCPLADHALQIVRRRERFKVMELQGPGRRLPVLGLLCETYSPATVPRECIPWWLRWMVVRRIWMRMDLWLRKKRLPRLS